MLDPWVQSYQTHKWKTYEITLGSPEKPPLEPETTLDVCCSESPRAKEIKDKPNRFYFDDELVAAELDPLCGGDLKRLTQEWRGHSAGKLVMMVFTGCDKNPPTFTYAWVGDFLILTIGKKITYHV